MGAVHQEGPLGGHPLEGPGKEGEGLMGDMDCSHKGAGCLGGQTFVVGEAGEGVELAVRIELVEVAGEGEEEVPQLGAWWLLWWLRCN